MKLKILAKMMTCFEVSKMLPHAVVGMSSVIYLLTYLLVSKSFQSEMLVNSASFKNYDILLFSRCKKVIDLNSMDYRDLGSSLKNIYFVDDDEGFETAWDRMVEGDGAKHEEHSTTIEVMAGRHLECPRSLGHSKATRFEFDELCARNLGLFYFEILRVGDEQEI